MRFLTSHLPPIKRCRPRIGCRDNFFQHLELLGGELDCKDGSAGEVAARPIEARHQAKFDRIGADNKNDRDCLRRGLGGERARCTEQRCNHGNLSMNQIGGQGGQQIVAIPRPAVFNRYISTVSVAHLSETAVKSGKVRAPRLSVGRTVHNSDHGHGWLCACRDRPRRRAAEQRDELAPPHEALKSRGKAYHIVRAVVQHSKINLSGTASGHEPNRSRMPVCQLSSAAADMPSDEAMDEKCHEQT
jgi:hypothetical protein